MFDMMSVVREISAVREKRIPEKESPAWKSIVRTGQVGAQMALRAVCSDRRPTLASVVPPAAEIMTFHEINLKQAKHKRLTFSKD